MIHGDGTMFVAEFDANNSQCEQCGKTGKRAAIGYEYNHIFFLPLGPNKKVVVTECKHCGHTTAGKVSEETLHRIRQKVGSIKPPLKIYAGFGAAMVLLMVFIGFIWHNAEQREAMAHNPQIGDMFVLEGLSDQPGYPFSLIQVVRGDSSSIELVSSGYLYNDASGFNMDVDNDEHLSTSYWETTLYMIPRSTLILWYDEENISRHFRGEPIGADTTLREAPHALPPTMSFEEGTQAADSLNKQYGNE